MNLLELVRSAVREIGTQKEAARKTGIAYATLQRMLSGDSPLTMERVGAISAVATGPTKVALDQYIKDGLVRGYVQQYGEAASTPFSRTEQSPPVRFVPLHDVTVSAGGGVNAVEAAESVENLGFPEAWLRSKFGDVAGLRIVKVKGDSMTPTVNDDDLVMFDINRKQPVDGIFVLRMNDQLMVKRVHFPSTRRLLITSDNRDYERFDRLIDLERDDTLDLIGRVVWAGKSL